MSLPVAGGPFELTVPSPSTRLIREHQGQIILPAPTTATTRRLAVRVGGNRDWAAVARAIHTSAAGTEGVISILVTDRKGARRSVGLPGVAALTGPIYVASRMPRSLAFDVAVLHQRGPVVFWGGRYLAPREAAAAISRRAHREQKWYLPAGQRFAKKLMPIWLEPERGATLQEVIDVLCAFQRAGLAASRLEIR